jgi:hypothetical protein
MSETFFGFTMPDVMVRTTDGRQVVLAEAMFYVSKAGEHIVVPAGATSDGASIPPEIWFKLPPFGLYWRPAVLHDYLYRNTARSREECDALLLEAMESCGVGLETRLLIYDGVRIGGWMAFAADRRSKEVANA